MTLVPESLQWIDPSGVVYNLSDDQPYYTPDPGMTGQYGLPLTVVTHQVPGQAGDIEQYIQINPNDVRFPLSIQADTWDVLEQARRTLLEATRPTRGVGILRHTANDGIVRDLFCKETDRMRNVAKRTPGLLLVGMVFRAADPYWYDKDFTNMLLTPGGVVNFFQNPFLPIHLSAGGLSGGFTPENIGQADAYPKWTITGPGINPVLTNVTTGMVLTLTITLTAGQVLTIDTNPDTLGVTRDNGSDQWGAVNSLSAMWPLVVGANAVTLGMTGTTSASSLELSWKNKWEGV